MSLSMRRSPLRSRAAHLAAVLVTVLAGAISAGAEEPVDWNAVSDVDTIQILTTDEDGATRDTTVWLAVWQGHGYIRSRGTHWLANIERDPDVKVRIAGQEYSLRATPIHDAKTYEAVSQVFREKYGWQDAVLGFFRNLSGVPTILQLDPRTSLAPIR